MNLKGILLSKRSLFEKVTYFIIKTIWHSGKAKTMKIGKRSVFARERVRGEGEMRGTEGQIDGATGIFRTE